MTAIFTPPVAGTYRGSGYCWLTAAGTAGMVQLSLRYNNGNSLGSDNLCGSAAMDLSANNHAGNIYSLHAGSGQAITYTITVAGLTGGAAAGMDLALEQLQ